MQLPPLQVTFAAADGQLEHGEYLFKTRGCMECHGADGAGHVVIDDKDSGFFVRTPNITSGGASPARNYTDADWVRALRHGVKPSGEPLQIMPSDDYAQMIDADVAAIAAYVRSLPPAALAAAQNSVRGRCRSRRRTCSARSKMRRKESITRPPCPLPVPDDAARARRVHRAGLARAVTARTSPAAKFRARRRRGPTLRI